MQWWHLSTGGLLGKRGVGVAAVGRVVVHAQGLLLLVVVQRGPTGLAGRLPDHAVLSQAIM